MITIRNETKADYQLVETIIRKAFYNLYVPGANEHYLAHIMRDHADFIPELDFVIEKDSEVIGNIMYTKAKLINEDGIEKPILTFGPVCIVPKYQRMGYGKMLLEHSFEKAIELGFDVIVIFGNPGNYVSRGFKSCKKFNVCVAPDTFPLAMLVKELVPNALDGRSWTYHDSPVMNLDLDEAKLFDDQLEKMEKKYQPSQEEFEMFSQAFLK